MGIALAMCAPARAQKAEAEVTQLVQSFLTAEEAYDAATLSKLINERYVEVSPAGEVDAHDRFLSFYTQDKKIQWPPHTVSDKEVRVFGDTAVMILKDTYTMPGENGKSHTLEIRGSFLAQRESGTWKLLGAQYTEIRPVPAKS
jgi:uncharacterized protein (TIGR02246 family)